ncbi:2-amino-4-hydroxy-6-hydroxymethyldihydropteridine diphosphokinase [Moritella marina ATCC 15381]|uniref:2-amino-4-hydroxy-6-hydroxymethyldihydropteridine diphosphokinase n=1 Tax=Moritella marina ATCC 15381 TaxID=1202962 RepID=A0A5J6WQ63_MORMI|nr:2-amino-4-hydroxy-6-hydroxymethyldihydropteridine diphosphokinase [Moritella marina]QFI39100.1 2-amino-4-hydroxy-6-hydroxymethyldihydropteridine diphosphokinase [Moritella marina ATCC 15381]
MALVHIGVGSNINKEVNVANALQDLDIMFDNCRVSSIFESAAVNCTGDNYYNLVVEFTTSLSITALMQCLKDLEITHGRKATDRRYAPRTLDLDLLLFDNVIQSESPVLPRPEILYHAFVLWPLAELAPDLCHPESGMTMAALWRDFDKSTQVLALAQWQWPAITELV